MTISEEEIIKQFFNDLKKKGLSIFPNYPSKVPESIKKLIDNNEEDFSDDDFKWLLTDSNI